MHYYAYYTLLLLPLILIHYRVFSRFCVTGYRGSTYYRKLNPGGVQHIG